MRVLMLSKACIVGIYQRKLEYIAQHGINLRVLVPPSWRDERGEQALERVYTQGYELCAIPIRRNGDFHTHYYPTLGREIRAFQPDIVHIDEEPYNLATWQALFFARRNRAKILFFSWQNITRHYPPPFSWGEKWVLNNSDYALMGTDSAGEVWREKGYTGNMAVIPQFGTDETLFTPTPQPSRPFTIGFIGRMVEEKGVWVLLEALRHLQGDWRCRLAGGGTLRDTLQNAVREMGLVERVAFIPQMPSTEIAQEYAQLDVLVLPSLTRPNWKEQFGRVLIEAMACEIPVVGSDSGAIPDVMGDGGIITPENNALALCEALQHLMNNPQERARLGKQGRARVLAHFTHKSIAQATVDVYHAMLK
jgi:glycosyltransferase involved in cell wall biosynthesis